MSFLAFVMEKFENHLTHVDSSVHLICNSLHAYKKVVLNLQGSVFIQVFLGLH